MNKQEEKVLKDYMIFSGTTAKSDNRLKKIEWIMRSSRKMIGKDLTKLGIKDIVSFLEKVNKSNYSDWTKNDYKKIFKRFLKWYYKDLELIEGMEVKRGFRGVSSKKAFNKNKINKNTLIKPEELEKLLRASDTLKWKAIISILYESAFRPCELVNLKWKDVKFNDSKGICTLTTISPKTGDLRSVPIKDYLVHLKRWEKEFQFPDLNKEDYVFPSQHQREEHLASQSITTMLRRLCEAAKIRHIFPYMLRHSRIYFIQKKLGARFAAKFAGHSIETSEIYNHLDSEDVEEIMMEKVYNTKELTEDEKNTMQKQIDYLIDKILNQEELIKAQDKKIVKLWIKRNVK